MEIKKRENPKEETKKIETRSNEEKNPIKYQNQKTTNIISNCADLSVFHYNISPSSLSIVIRNINKSIRMNTKKRQMDLQCLCACVPLRGTKVEREKKLHA